MLLKIADDKIEPLLSGHNKYGHEFTETALANSN